MMKSLALILSAFAALSSPAVSQEIEPLRRGGISVVSEPTGAEVWIGDSLIGRTPLEMQGGEHDTLIVYHPSRWVWRASRTILAPPHPDRSSGVVRAELPRRIRVSSTPAGAALSVDGEPAGYTPIELRLSKSASLSFKRPDCADAEAVWDIEEDEGENVHVILQPISGRKAVQPVLRDQSGLRIPSAAVISTSAAALGVGIGAVALKLHADRRYEAYLATGDRAALEEAGKYDIYSGVGLALLQAGIGYLVYLLFNDD
jgi:hypothetical protein